MKLYMGVLYQKFYAEQEERRKEYEQAGMSKEKIAEILKYDRKVFARDIAFLRHTVRIKELNKKDEEENEINILDKLLGEEQDIEEQVVLNPEFAWVEKIKDDRLRKLLYCLTNEELELIWLKYWEDYSYEAIKDMLEIKYRESRKGIEELKKFANWLYGV